MFLKLIRIIKSGYLQLKLPEMGSCFVSSCMHSCKDSDSQNTNFTDFEKIEALVTERNLLIKELQMSKKRIEELQRLEKERQSLKAKIEANRNSQQLGSLPIYLMNRATKFFSEKLIDMFNDYKIYLTETIKKEIGLVPRHDECHKERNRLNAKLQDSNKKVERLQAELQAYKRKADSLQQQLTRNVTETRKLLSPTEEQKHKILICEQTINQLQKDIDILKSQLTKNNQLISSLQAKNKLLTQKNQQLLMQNQSLKAKMDAKRNSQDSESIPNYLVHRATKYFSGDVLNQFDDYKIYLTKILEKEMDMTIKSTQLLFRYEKAFPRNLHQPIDGHSPIVVLLKTVKGYHIACVSEAPFAPRSNMLGRGWLISLTKGRVYRAALDKEAILYDEKYLIFGNQDIRIDGSSNRVFSNFGISKSYSTTGNDVRDFLGPGLEGTPREAELESFEIFKLHAE